MSLASLIDAVTDKVIGRVEAGACDTLHGCCCKPGHPKYAFNCLATKCIKQGSCSNGPNCHV
jgi:hypothetical protein